MLSSSFPGLSTEKQVDALQNHWDVLGSPAMLPVLRTLASASPPPGAVFRPFANSHDLRSAALERWYEFDPEGALREVLDQIGSAQPSLTAADIWFLPPQSFPQFESVWSQALPQTGDSERRSTLAELLTRFGTGAASPEVGALLTRTVGAEDCSPQSAELAYLVRFDPDTARRLLHEAIAARGEHQNGCRHMIFSQIARLATAPVLAEAAAEAVADPDPGVVADALRYLIQYGDDSARAPILKRYLQWSGRWAQGPPEPSKDMPDAPTAITTLARPWCRPCLATRAGSPMTP